MLESPTAPTSQPTPSNTNEQTTGEQQQRRRAAFMTTTEENQFTPSKIGKFSSSTKKKGQDDVKGQERSTTSIELQQGPSDDTEPQTGPRPEISETGGKTNFSHNEPQNTGSPDNDYPILTNILIKNPLTNENQPRTQGTCNTHVLYDPKLRDGKNVPKATLRGFGSECRWKNCCPLEPQSPENYNRPELEQLAPKMEYPINAYFDFTSHLLHLNIQYLWRGNIRSHP
jgi:hypothetical protein